MARENVITEIVDREVHLRARPVWSTIDMELIQDISFAVAKAVAKQIDGLLSRRSIIRSDNPLRDIHDEIERMLAAPVAAKEKP